MDRVRGRLTAAKALEKPIVVVAAEKRESLIERPRIVARDTLPSFREFGAHGARNGGNAWKNFSGQIIAASLAKASPASGKASRDWSTK